MLLQKDEMLDALAVSRNVAQFVSFGPGRGGNLIQRYSRVEGYEANYVFGSVGEAVAALLRASREGSINIRSYMPENPRSREFVYGLKNAGDALAAITRLAADGLHLIANETVDVADGGVSGVVQGHLVEFAPDDTPRCVEKPGAAALPFTMAVKMLEMVYGFQPEIEPPRGGRLEFSIHPGPRGVRASHTLVWEQEYGVADTEAVSPRWPNRFSRHLGDKVFGLLIAHLLGLPVPMTLVIGRRVKPFSFGRSTGSAEVWTRTCPAEPVPGLFTTVKGWVDPFRLLWREDPEDDRLASVLSQAAVHAKYSGAVLTDARGEVVVEGRAGEGEGFMLGRDAPQMLPEQIERDVLECYVRLASELGPVRFEWVHDGSEAWIVQLHVGQTTTLGSVIVPGDPDSWIEFDGSLGVEALRRLLEGVAQNTGVILAGDVGLTSHLADLLRRAGRPARVKHHTQSPAK